MAINSTKTEIKDRLRNPLVGSFVISWMLINWKVTLALIYSPDDKYIGRIEYISSYIGENYSNLIFKWNLFLGPLVIAIVSIVLSQYIKLIYFYFEDKFEHEKNLRREQNLCDENEVKAHRWLIKDCFNSTISEFNNLDELIKASKNNLESAMRHHSKTEIRNFNSRIEEVRESLNKIEETVRNWKSNYKHISQANNKSFKQSIDALKEFTNKIIKNRPE